MQFEAIQLVELCYISPSKLRQGCLPRKAKSMIQLEPTAGGREKGEHAQQGQWENNTGDNLGATAQKWDFTHQVTVVVRMEKTGLL